SSFLLIIEPLTVPHPYRDLHNRLHMTAVAYIQLLKGRAFFWFPRHGRGYAVLLKIVLATLLLGHTGEMGINSSYWPIYFVPVVTAATYFGPWGTLFWTALASAAYCSYLIPALQEYALTWEGLAE